MRAKRQLGDEGDQCPKALASSSRRLASRHISLPIKWVVQ